MAQVDEEDPHGPPADPAALKAFTEIVQSYRARPALTIKSTVKVQMKQGDTNSDGKEVKAEFTFGPNRSAVIKLNGLTCYMYRDPEKPDPENPEAGTITAVHEKTDHSYYVLSDDGSPYYILLNLFHDLPYPELAIGLGEDKIEDVLTQFHQKAPFAQPTAVSAEEKDGKKTQRLTLTGLNEKIELDIDPDTKLIRTMDMTISGGAYALSGTSITYHNSYEYQTYDKPLDVSTFKFDPGQRQRVDMIAALSPRPVAPEPGAGGGEGGEQVGPLKGKPAPAFTLATADGKAIDLADLKGRVVVLDFWAVWCPPCRGALPKLHEVAKWAKDEELPVTVIAVNVFEHDTEGNGTPDVRLDLVRKFWDKMKFTLPVAMDYTDETGHAYGVSGIPATFIIRSDGIVHEQHTGAGADYANTLKEGIKDALKAVEGAAVEPAAE